MDDLVADDFVDMVIELRQEVKAIKARLTRLERDTDLLDDLDGDDDEFR